MNKQVKEALHVSIDIKWKEPSGQNGEIKPKWFHYTKTQTNLKPFYKQIIEEGKYKILIYNGDVDTAVPTNGAANWTSSLGFDVYPDENWRPYTTDGQMDMCGYITIYETLKNFTFATVRGAGHMVPQYKPRQSLTLIKNFVLDIPYPRYSYS